MGEFPQPAVQYSHGERAGERLYSGRCLPASLARTATTFVVSVTLTEAIILGIVQGATEFLPVSSSAHLLIVPALAGWADPGAAFTAVIQCGTLVAILGYFRADVLRIATAWVRELVGPDVLAVARCSHGLDDHRRHRADRRRRADSQAADRDQASARCT